MGERIILKFDGKTLSAIDDDGAILRSWSAISGNRGFQNPALQKHAFIGPLPSGSYDVLQSRYQRFEDLPIQQKIAAWALRGQWPGGDYSWGPERVWIDPQPGTDTHGRDDFSIHGGVKPGSAGCIDLVENVSDFMEFFRTDGRDATLIVDYGDFDGTDHPLLEGWEVEQVAPDDKSAIEDANNDQCFGDGTSVAMADGSRLSIEDIKIGDWVVAFNATRASEDVEPVHCRVSHLHTREVEETLDFHGTIVTPGHVFLSGDGTFKKLADILEEDGTVVREDGTVVRARTNCPVGSDEDRVVPLRYTDPETGESVTASIRAGAPFAADGDKVVTVAEAMRKIGYELGADGLFVDLDGNKVPAQWPWGKPEPTNLAENRVSFV